MTEHEIYLSKRDAIIKGTEICPFCAGDLIIRVGRGFTKCWCYQEMMVKRGFEKLANIPPRYANITLSTLEPNEQLCGLPIERQAEIIAQLQAEPNRSYAFFGPPGTSKTHFSVALYRSALTDYLFRRHGPDSKDVEQAAGVTNLEFHQPAVWRDSAKTLMENFHREATGVADESGQIIRPQVNRILIETVAKKRKGSQAFRPCLFLSEIDKIKMTKFKADALFELVDAIYENSGQLVFDCNLTPYEFVASFLDQGMVGAAIMRRLAEGGCTIFDFFTEV